jgi:hypothetical protein
MPLAPDLVNGCDLLKRLVETPVAEHREHQPELLGAERVVVSDLALLDDDEAPVRRYLEASLLGKALRLDGDGVGRPMALVVPEHGLELLRFVRASEVPSLGHQAVAQGLVNAVLYDEIAVG